MHYMVPLFSYTHNFVIVEGPSLYLRIVQVFSQMNNKYPTFFLTWFNKILRVSYPGFGVGCRLVWVREK